MLPAVPRITTTTETVQINSLKPYPNNARRGDIGLIAESLTAHGQYRPIVASVKTTHILAGNHTWEAAKLLGWDEIAVTWIDVDRKEEARIVLADNRTSDLASYNDAMHAELLSDMSDLTGTGFTRDDIEAMEGLWANPTPLSSAPVDDLPQDARIIIGPHRLSIERDIFEAWAVPIDQNPLKPEENLRRMLGLPAKSKPARTNPEDAPVKLSSIQVESVPLSELRPYPSNARQGDVGAIAESLSVNGQYRPIVVNRRDNCVLVGNHTAQAAKHLGWGSIAVTYVDVDEEEARKIVLVDNRTSDVATYETRALARLLQSLNGDLVGTGYAPEDLDDLLTGSQGRTSQAVSTKPVVKIDRWTIKPDPQGFKGWLDDLGSDPIKEIATRLVLPDDSWSSNGN